MNTDLAASIAIKNKNNVWIEDNMATCCHKCKSPFSFLLRRGHCRNCGNLFCRYCCNKFIKIPTFIEDRPEPGDIWNISHYIPYFRSPLEKVCNTCFDDINLKIRVFEKITEVFNNPVSIETIRELSESDCEVKKHYFDKLRNIQYYLPNHNYNEVDRNILKVNAAYFCKHSKYIVHLIKSIDFLSTNRINDTNFVMSILHSEKKKECCELYCTRTCHDNLSIDDCINILYKNPENLPDEILKYVFNIINNSPDNILILNLPFFVNLIKNNYWNKNLLNLLKTLLTRSETLIYQTFWYLNIFKETSSDTQLSVIRQFIESLDPGLVRQMTREYMFYVGIVNNLSNPRKFLEEELGRFVPISLPYNPRLKIVSADLESIVVKPSNSKPVIITFTIVDSINGILNQEKVGKVKLMFKPESVMKDITVLNLMSICNVLFEEELNINTGAITYPVMPLTSGSGMIEIVENAKTLYEIYNKGLTIKQFISENNENLIGKEVSDKYMYSLVTYTLYSYLIGIGDRHKHNIMISNEGLLFNIDFGYILGKDAYILNPSEIRIDSDMIDALNGHNSVRYKKYIQLCSIGIIYLRKFFNIFFILLSQCPDLKIKHIEWFIMSRFQPRQVDDVIIEELISIIDKSDGAYTEYVRDIIHYHTQEKTFQNGFSKILQYICSKLAI